jgi:Icc-related predicted phosphoesterase
VLRAHPRIECPERELAALGPIRLASLGNTNRTPWHTDREYDEEELTRQIAQMLEGDDGGDGLVFNFHCPPYRSGLDDVVKLDERLTPVVQNGAPVQVPVGSVAVREAIERYAPEVGLHGHIHEGRGETRIGRTLCLNPGSDYGAGTLNGAIVDFGPDGAYRSHLLTIG